jgi:hypothetical protein
MKKCRRGKGTRGQRQKSNGHVVRDGALTHVDGELAEIRVKLAGETQAGRDAGHDDGHEVVEIGVGRHRELERPEADVVQRLVVDAERLVRVLNELVDGERRVIGLDDGVRDFGRRHDRVRAHHPVGVLLADLRDQEGTHSGASATTERVGDLEACGRGQTGRGARSRRCGGAYLAAHRCPRPPCGRRPARSRRARRPRCSLRKGRSATIVQRARDAS